MLATLTSAALVGIDAVPVQVEVNANERGEPRLIIMKTIISTGRFSLLNRPAKR